MLVALTLYQSATMAFTERKDLRDYSEMQRRPLDVSASVAMEIALPFGNEGMSVRNLCRMIPDDECSSMLRGLRGHIKICI